MQMINPSSTAHKRRLTFVIKNRDIST